LDNFTGNFTPGNTAALYYPYILKNAEIRITIGSTVVFTGYVDRWDTSVNSNGECLTVVTCSDRGKFLNKNPLGAYGVERAKQLVSTNGVVYPLAANGADSTATFAAWRDTSAAALSIISGSAGTFEWSTESPPFGAGSLRLIPDNTSQVGPCVEVGKTFDPGTGGTVFGFFRTYEGVAAAGVLYRMVRTSGGTGYVQVSLDNTGNLNVGIVADGGTTATVVSSTSGFDDNAWHSFAVKVATTGKTVTAYLDGVSVGTATVGTALTIGASNRRGVFGALRTSAWTGNTYTFPGWISTIGVSSAVWTNAQVLAFHNAIQWGDAGDTIATRAQNIMLSLYPSGSPAVTVSNVSGMQVMGQDTKGKSALQVLEQIADSERGIVYVDRLNALKFRGSTARTAASILTIDALADLDGSSGCNLLTDDQLFANRIRATGPAGAYTAEDSTSISSLGIVSEDWNCVAYQLQTRTDARLADRLSDEPRIGQITVDLMTASAVSLSSVLTLVPLDRITLTNLPAQLGVTTRDGIIEGYELTASENTYTVTLDLSPTG
jgi:hypothetical protein